MIKKDFLNKKYWIIKHYKTKLQELDNSLTPNTLNHLGTEIILKTVPHCWKRIFY